MTSLSPLKNVLKKGFYGNFEGKENIIKIKEIKNLLIFQIVQYKNSSLDLSKLKIDGIFLPKNLKCTSNSNTRILWMGPKNYLIISSKVDLINNILNDFREKDFAITTLSESRAIIEMEGINVNEVIKKGCPINIKNLGEGDCCNSIYHGITITIDFIENNPFKVRFIALRSFGESLFHSITDASLEYGYEII